MRRAAFLLAALLAGATAASAQDSTCTSSYGSGAWLVRECYICDGDHTATDCAEFDLNTEAPEGLPEYMVFDLVNSCGGTVSVDVRGLATQLGIPYVYGTLTGAGVSSIRVGNPYNPNNYLDLIRHRHIDADVDITTSAACTDLELVVRLMYPRTRFNR